MSTADALAWLLTYALHSTLLLGGAWLLTERGPVHSHRLRDLFWKTALAGSIVTATAQVALQRADWTRGLAPAATPSVVIAPGDLPMPMPVGLGRRAVPEAGSAGYQAAGTAPALPLAAVLVGLWGLVAAAGIARLVLLHRRFSLRLGQREPVRSLPVLTLLEELRVASGTTLRVRLTRSDALGSPVALGTSEI
ncbi:MAG TPA: hypothetical protein VFU00_11180, partial [Gemmatimonadales bacterium]|nr:hypothetical protein [Gemmatimonadales bacterium]